MDNIIGHEKYISIEYDKWENFYKKLEEENSRLKQDLERSKVKMGIQFMAPYFYNRSRDIGFVTIYVDKPFSVEIEASDIQDQIIRELEASHYSLAKNAMSHEQARDYIQSMEEKAKRMENTLAENLAKIERIPKFLKRLFKIKY